MVAFKLMINIAGQIRAVSMKLIALCIFHAIHVHVYENVVKQVLCYDIRLNGAMKL